MNQILPMNQRSQKKRNQSPEKLEKSLKINKNTKKVLHHLIVTVVRKKHALRNPNLTKS